MDFKAADFSFLLTALLKTSGAESINTDPRMTFLSADLPGPSRDSDSTHLEIVGASLRPGIKHSTCALVFRNMQVLQASTLNQPLQVKMQAATLDWLFCLTLAGDFAGFQRPVWLPSRQPSRPRLVHQRVQGQGAGPGTVWSLQRPPEPAQTGGGPLGPQQGPLTFKPVCRVRL